MRFARVVVLLCLGMSGCEESPAPAPRPRAVAPKETRASDEARLVLEVVQPFLVEAPYRAIGVVVVDGSDTRFHVFGSRRMTNAAPFDPDTTFEIGSVSKVFAGLLLVDAERRGELALDDPIAAHLPDWKLPSRDGNAMTLRHAATHSTGLPMMPDNWIRTDPVLHTTRYTETMFRDNLATHALATTPGAKYVYSNQGTALLGLVLERRSGSKYSALLQTRLFEPLGMSRSGRSRWIPHTPKVAGAHSAGSPTRRAVCYARMVRCPAIEPTW